MYDRFSDFTNSSFHTKTKNLSTLCGMQFLTSTVAQQTYSPSSPFLVIMTYMFSEAKLFRSRLTAWTPICGHSIEKPSPVSSLRQESSLSTQSGLYNLPSYNCKFLFEKLASYNYLKKSILA